MKTAKLFIAAALIAGLASPALVSADKGKTMITPTLESINVMHNGKSVTIHRSNDKNAVIPAPYNKTSRGCPPFCVQPMEVIPGVQTIGELEVISYLKAAANGDKSAVVVDSRTSDWMARGTIPGSINIPWNQISVDETGNGGLFETEEEQDRLDNILSKTFGGKQNGEKWDFSGANTLVMFCNGAWCPQSGNNLKTLTRLGYPVSKLKWYRGGMQDWVSFGLTTVKK